MSKYQYIKIGLASPEKIRKWSFGEVKKHETINYRTLKPETDGLFCEKIFGPTKDYQCNCGKSKRTADKGKSCPTCGVEITDSKVRRERMGHIELASPVVHTWFLKSIPSPLATILELKNKDLESIVYFASYVVINPGNTQYKYKDLIDEATYTEIMESDCGKFKASIGAEAILELLKDINLKKETEKLRKELKTKSKQKREGIIKKLEIMESFLNSSNKPEWMVITVLPIIPPDLRPMVQLDGGRFATTDLNDLYRRILNRNNRLKLLIEQDAPHLIIKNERRMLQEAVDSLIDNSKKSKKNIVEKNGNLKSLSDMLRGKQGRFRQNLLGKRVDYSGRSVIVVGPDLKMYQCGIPREMALILFKPFVINRLVEEKGLSVPAAKKACERQDEYVWEFLDEVVVEHPVLLNRAPTLHRLGIQAFEPKLIEGKAIRLHPLVCTAFNADFDGDQMAVHVPLSQEAQAETRVLMLASNNILNPKDGKPVVTPSQDLVLGNYYLTIEKKGLPKEGHFYKDYDEAYTAYKNNEITLHTRIFVDKSYISDKKIDSPKKYLFTTLGKMIFNSIIPDKLPYINEPIKSNIVEKLDDKYLFDPRVDNIKDFLDRDVVEAFKKKFLADIIAQVFKFYKINETSIMLDKLKDLGFHYATKSGITISMSDVIDYKDKEKLIKEVDDKVEKINELYELGKCDETERKHIIQKEWADVRNEIEKGAWQKLSEDKDNAIYLMAASGARSSSSNFAQLAGMRGLMNNTSGGIIEVPVKANFREGLSVSEFFISTHGARKGSTDTALKTAESGYLTRRLVDVAQDIIINEDDCGTEQGIIIEAVKSQDGKEEVVPVAERVLGRFLASDLYTNDGILIAKRNNLVTEEIQKLIIEHNIEKVNIRTNLTCQAKRGLCTKCYGKDLASDTIVDYGGVVGVVAAQSIGEPGTQLTMRTFHSGGVASTSDITQGLPRVQELFEARKPKGATTISEISGKVKIEQNSTYKNFNNIIIENKNESKTYIIPMDSELLIYEGQEIERGQALSKGPIDPKEILKVKDAKTAQIYIVDEVQKVYRSQGVEISDKHIEIIVRQMMRRLYVVHEGDTKLIPGKDVSIDEFKEETKNAILKGKALPIARPLLLGITKASLSSESFLSACSFQETTRILTAAAIKSKKDYLLGLKENVIVGGLIPAGTGLVKK